MRKYESYVAAELAHTSRILTNRSCHLYGFFYGNGPRHGRHAVHSVLTAIDMPSEMDMLLSESELNIIAGVIE